MLARIAYPYENVIQLGSNSRLAHSQQSPRVINQLRTDPPTLDTTVSAKPEPPFHGGALSGLRLYF